MLRLVRRGGRGVWHGPGCVHVVLREVPSATAARFRRALQTELGALPAVRYAAINQALGTAVVAYDRRRLPRGGSREQRLDRFEQRVVDAVARAEQAHGLRGRPFTTSQRTDGHPGDWTPLARTLAEIALDGASVGAIFVRRRLGIKRAGPLGLDAAALLALVSNVPLLRRRVEKLAGPAATELGLELGSAVIQMLLQGQIGATSNTLHRLLRLRELRARRKLWLEREARLCGFEQVALQSAARDARPQPLPEGPVERYTAKAAAGSLGTFAGTLLATGRHEAAAAIIAGMPKPARHGRDAFAAHLGTRLAGAGILVTNPQVLRQLDRIDCAVLGPGLERLDGDVAGLVAAVRRAGLQCAAGNDLNGCDELRVLRESPGRAIRRLQMEGRAVLLIDAGPGDGYAQADCAIALGVEGPPAPWHAHLWCPGGIEQAKALIEATALARLASEQSMELSLAEVVLGIALSSAGVDERSTRRILTAASSTSIVAMANGVRLAQRAALPSADRAPAPPWHSMPIATVLAKTGSRRQGLSTAEARRRLRRPPSPPGALLQTARLLHEELRNPMMPVLIAGAALAAASGGAADAGLIVATLLVNTVYGSAERLRTDRVVRRLARNESAQVRVLRDGSERRIAVSELVLGDVISLASGDAVPADCRLIEAQGLEVDESALTGESLPVAKRIEPSEARALAERHSMLYEGTSLAAGSARAVVVALGADTESRRAAEAAAAATPAATGVEQRLEELTRHAAPIAAGAGLLLAAAARLRGKPMQDVLSTAVSLSVAAVPEGLPLLAGLAQATVAGRLSTRGTLVRDPRAVEALGRMDVLCADKTGTLTEGRIRLRLVSDGDSERTPENLGDRHRRVLAIARRASPSANGDEPLPHLTDRALVDGADAAQVGSHDDLHRWQRLDELPFEPGRAFHAGLAQHRDGHLISVKGAPETVLPRCSHRAGPDGVTELGAGERQRLAQQADRLARRGFRVLAVAEREAGARRRIDDGRVQNLCFHGFVGFADAVRPEAQSAVAALGRAGIRVIMLTGDHPQTAQAIAREIGLPRGEVLTGADLDTLDEPALARRIGKTTVFARVTPAHKLRIVRALQSTGRVVGMTGDGANDAPAIRLAEVGIALGERATAAAREAADIVVTDGRIETIVAAVLEGRALWLSVREAVSLLVGGNLGEVLFTVAGGLGREGAPLNARQLLLVNLLSDAVPALAVALRPPGDVTPEKLLRAGPDTSLGKDLQRALAFRAAATASGAMTAWLSARLTGNREGAGSVALLALTGTQLLQALIAGRGDRTVTLSSLGTLAVLLGAVQTPGASQLLGCRPQGPLGLLQAAFGSATGVAVHALLPRLDRWLRASKPKPPGGHGLHRAGKAAHRRERRGTARSKRAAAERSSRRVRRSSRKSSQ